MHLVFFALAAMLCAPGLRAQSQKTEALRPGRLLIANRGTRDPNFAESVILLVDYSKDGAFGLIINRPTRLSVAEGLATLRGSEEYHGPVYLGGPVARNSVMGLLRDPAGQPPEDEPLEAEPHPRKRVFGDVFLISRKAVVEAALATRAGPARLRLFVGYSGWGAGQLETEMERGDWFIFEPSEAIVFDPNPEAIWPQLIDQTELRTAQVRDSGFGAWMPSRR